MPTVSVSMGEAGVGSAASAAGASALAIDEHGGVVISTMSDAALEQDIAAFVSEPLMLRIFDLLTDFLGDMLCNEYFRFSSFDQMFAPQSGDLFVG